MEDPTDYKALFLKAAEERKQAEEREKQEVVLRRRAEEGETQERERTRRTTFDELIRYSHDLLSQPLSVEKPRLMRGPFH
jgi:hypothetical protein